MMRIVTYFSILQQFDKIDNELEVPIGAIVTIDRSSDSERERRTNHWKKDGRIRDGQYISFAQNPAGGSLYDSYGVLDEEIFSYLSRRELMSRVFKYHSTGWRIKSCQIVSAKNDLL